jgi:alkane 1-monooxygenase
MITLGCYVIDRLARGDAAQRQTNAEFPSGTILSAGLAVLHLPMLALSVWAITSASYLLVAERLALLVGFGLFFGQISHPNAHELIHRSNRWLRTLGVMTYSTLLIGHHASAHRLVHHVHVGTEKDPNSAPKGKGFWRFLLRAWPASFLAGLQAERALRRRAPRKSRPINPYFIYLFWYIISLSSSYALADFRGVFVLFTIAVYAQIQIFLADYVQHYGLRRKLDPTGKPEPVADRHSWNSPHLGSSAMMLNAPRHSDHHVHPTRHYPALTLDTRMPILPYSLPVMAVVALVPPVWRRLMDPRVAALDET